MSDGRVTTGRDLNDLMRRIPSVDIVLGADALVEVAEEMAASYLTILVRQEIEALRNALRRGNEQESFLEVEEIASRVAARARLLLAGSMKQVLNATGILLHTNLGRSCVSPAAAEAMARAASGNVDLEFDLETGRRGDRYRCLRDLVCLITGCEDAIAVNNCAAALLLSLSTLAKGREVIVSRSEMVEIGGSFRIPSVCEAAGCRLVEVGCTNKTHLADYEAAITDETAVLLKIHHSNYRIEGFTESVSAAELRPLARERGLLVLEDLGSGCFLDLAPYGVRPEPTVASVVESGVDLVCFSGDKLLGASQAGLLLGTKETIGRVRKNQLLRALRLDKAITASLAVTFAQYLRKAPEACLPFYEALGQDLDELEAAADAFVEDFDGARLQLRKVACDGQIGAGACPGDTFPSWGIALQAVGVPVERLSLGLRLGDPPVVGYVRDDEVVLDLRSVPSKERPMLHKALEALDGTLTSEALEAVSEHA